jgi:hypothetical protein
MRLCHVTFFSIAALCLSGCDRHAIDITQPSAAQVDSALKQFRTIAPATSTGRWEVSVSIPGVKLEGLDKKSADQVRALGKALNTTARCRTEPYAVDTYSEISIGSTVRKGCMIERLTADPNMLSYTSKCVLGDAVLRAETRMSFQPDRFVTVRKSSIDYNGNGSGETRTKQYDGHYVGACRGDELNQQALWSDKN